MQPKRTREKDTGWDELDGEWYDPLLVAGGHRLTETKVDPEANQTADLPAKFVDTDESTSHCRWCNLRYVNGNDHRSSSYA